MIHDHKMNILVVDDSSSMRSIIKNILHQMNYPNVTEAEDGAQALAKLDRGGFHLVIADWNMPVMNGLEMLEKIRSDPHHKGLPVLMVTGEAEQDHVIAAIRAGVSNYVVKPFTAEILKEKIDKIFERFPPQ